MQLVSLTPLVRRVICILFCVSLAPLFVGCGTFGTSSKDEETAKLNLEIGTQQLQSGAYPQALATLLKAEGLDPNNAMVQNNLGLAYFVRDKFEDAAKHIARALTLKKDFTDAHNNLGRVYIEMGRYPEALEQLKIAESDLTYVTPEKPLINMGIVYFKMKDYAHAREVLVKALNIQRDNCESHSYLGRTYYELRDYPKAAAELDRAVGFCQRTLFDEPQYYSALSYYEIGDAAKAETRLQDLLKLYPNGKYYDKAKSMLDIMRK